MSYRLTRQQRARIQNQANKVAFAAAAAGARRLYNTNAKRGIFNPPKSSTTVGYPAYKNYKTYKKPRQTTLKKQVKDLQRKVNADFATHTYKRTVYDRALCSTSSQVEYTGRDVITMNRLENSIQSLRYYDPGTNALVTNDITSGTYARDVYFAGIYAKVTARNNYRVPVNCSVYLLRPKKDSSVTPEVRFSNGMADQKAPATTSELVQLTDSDEFNEHWSIVAMKKKLLNPGEQMSCKYVNSKGFMYNPADFDSHALTYQKKYGSLYCIFRLHGVLTHDSTTTTLQGLSLGGVDTCVKAIYKVKYDAGQKLNDFTILDGADTIVNDNVGLYRYSTNQNFSLT